MLVLTRRPGEQIVIAGNIRLTVVNVGPGRVKIGIEAPPDVRIDRQEIFDKIQQEQASDVLHAVANGVTSDDASPTIVAAGAGDTQTRLPALAPESVPVTARELVSAAVSQPRVRKPR